MEKIFIAQISLHYEDRGTIIHYWSRERYARELLQRKKKFDDWFLKRVTESKANEIQEQTDRENIIKQYDKAIMKKYNVGSNYKQNRYFMEQVRPTIN